MTFSRTLADCTLNTPHLEKSPCVECVRLMNPEFPCRFVNPSPVSNLSYALGKLDGVRVGLQQATELNK